MKIINRCLITIFTFLLITGCYGEQNVYESYDEAKEHFLTVEEVNEQEIVEEFEVGNNHVILFEQFDGEEKVYAITNFIEQEDGSLERDDTSAKISIAGTEDGRPVGTEYETKDNKMISFKVGIYDVKSYEELDEDIKQGVISVDEERGIYCMVDIEI